jgi:hypothetical protein
LIETDLNDVKERISVGVVTLVAARAGCMLTGIEVDRESIDVTIRPVKGPPVCIDAQLKSSSSLTREENHLVIDLPVKNYNDLCSEVVGNARILVVMDLDADQHLWLEVGADFIRAKRAAYWIDLYGEAPSTNSTRKRVRIPLAQPFTANSLVGMMERRYDNLVGGLGGVS